MWMCDVDKGCTAWTKCAAWAWGCVAWKKKRMHNLDKRCMMWTRVHGMNKMRSVGKGCVAWKNGGAQSEQEVCDVDKGVRHGQDAQRGQGVHGVEKRGAQSGQEVCVDKGMQHGQGAQDKQGQGCV
jgi:hypothetical protein